MAASIDTFEAAGDDAEAPKVKCWRQRVAILRLQVREQRMVISLKRKAMLDADEQFIKKTIGKYVTPQLPAKTDEQILENLRRACQAARDECCAAEDAYQALEYRLAAKEDKLSHVEERLWAKLSLLQNLDKDYGNTLDEGQNTSTSENALESEHEDKLYYDDYLHRLGDLDLIREGYEELIFTKENLKAKRELGIDLNAEDRDFLAHFGETMERMRSDLDQVSEDVKRLKHLCVKKGLVDAAGNPIEELTRDKMLYLESGENSQKVLVGKNGVDSTRHSSQRKYGPFFNIWLLDKLRCSDTEFTILANFAMARLNILDWLTW